MSKVMKKSILFLLSTILVISMVACAGDTQNQTSEPGTDQTTSSDTDSTTEPPDDSNGYSIEDIAADKEPVYDPIGKYDETVEVTTIHMANDGAFWFPEGDDVNDNIYTRTWKDTLNVEYSFLWTSPGGQGEERFNIMLVSGELPDMMAVNRRQFEQLMSADLLADITDDIVEYASNYTKKYLTGDFEPLLRTAVKDERVYGMPNGFSYHDASDMIWVRVDWLENVGRDIPKTFDELEEIMDLFVNADPNQSGANDTYAFSYSGGSQSTWQWGAPNAFFSMFDVYPNISITEGTNGLQDGLLGAGQREKTLVALEKLKEYYDAGYIDPDYLTFDGTRYQEDLVSGKVGIVFGGVWEAYWPLILHLDNEPEADWAPIQIPGINGETASSINEVASVANINVVRKGYENPEALVKMCNLYHDLNNNPETMKFTEYNVWPEDNNQIFLAYPLLIYNPAFNFEGYEFISAAFESGDTSALSEAYKLFYDQAVDYAETKDPSGWPAYRSYTDVGSMHVIEQNIINKNLKFNEYTEEPTQHMLDNLSTVKTIYDETVVNIISGNADSSTFNVFLEQYDALYYDVAKAELDAWFQSKEADSIQSWFEAQ